MGFQVPQGSFWRPFLGTQSMQQKQCPTHCFLGEAGESGPLAVLTQSPS